MSRRKFKSITFDLRLYTHDFEKIAPPERNVATGEFPRGGKEEGGKGTFYYFRQVADYRKSCWNVAQGHDRIE